VKVGVKNQDTAHYSVHNRCERRRRRKERKKKRKKEKKKEVSYTGLTLQAQREDILQFLNCWLLSSK